MSIRIKATLYVLIVSFLHFMTIYFLKLKTEDWNEEIVKQTIIMYSAAIILTYFSCKMALKTRKLRYNIAWLVISIFPSTFFLFYLKEIKGTESNGSGFIELDFGPLDLTFIFPVSYVGIQIVLILLLSIMIYSKEKAEDE